MSFKSDPGFENSVDQSQLEQAAEFLRNETGIPWRVEGDQLRVTVITEAQTLQENTEKFQETLRHTLQEHPEAVHILAKNESVNASIHSPRVIAHLAEKFKGVLKRKLTLSIDENDLCAAAEYLKKLTGNLHLAETTKSLPLQLITLTKEGLIIHLPKELFESSIGDKVEALAKQMAKQIEKKVSLKTFTACLTIPFPQIEAFLEEELQIKNPTSKKHPALIDEMLAEYHTGNKLLTDDQIEQLRKESHKKDHS